MSPPFAPDIVQKLWFTSQTRTHIWQGHHSPGSKHIRSKLCCIENNDNLESASESLSTKLFLFVSAAYKTTSRGYTASWSQAYHLRLFLQPHITHFEPDIFSGPLPAYWRTFHPAGSGARHFPVAQRASTPANSMGQATWPAASQPGPSSGNSSGL